MSERSDWRCPYCKRDCVTETHELERLRAQQLADDNLIRGYIAEIERLQRENGSLAQTYAACERMLRERTEQLNQADAEIARLLGTNKQD